MWYGVVAIHAFDPITLEQRETVISVSSRPTRATQKSRANWSKSPAMQKNQVHRAYAKSWKSEHTSKPSTLEARRRQRETVPEAYRPATLEYSA